MFTSIKYTAILAFLVGMAIPISTSLQNVTIALLCLNVLIDKNLRSNIKQALSNYFVLSSVLLYLVVLLWIFKTQAPTADIVHMVKKMRIFLLCPLILAYFSHSQNRVLACYGFIFGAIITCIISIFLFITKIHILNSGVYDWTGPFGDWAVFRYHTYHNYFLAIMVTVLLSLVLYYNKSINKYIKISIYIVITLASIDILYLVQGRAGQILFILMLSIVCFLWNYRKGSVLVAVIGLITLFSMYTSPAISSGFKRLKDDVSRYNDGQIGTSVGARIEFAKYSKLLIKKKPLIGYGTGNFYTEYQKLTNFENTRVPRHPHNDFYWLWIELGILGPLLLSAIVFYICYYAVKLHSAEGKIAIAIAISYIFGALQGGFFTDNISSSAFIVLVCIFLYNNTLSKLIKHEA